MRESLRRGPPAALAWVEAFVASLRVADLAPATIRGYTYDLTQFRRWYTDSHGHDLRLEDLTPIDLLTYRRHLLTDQQLRATTVNRRVDALRRLGHWAYRQGLLQTDVAQEIQALRTPRRHRPHGLTPRDVQQLLQTAGTSQRGLARRNYALVQCMLQTGLRLSEVAALRWGDLTLRMRSGTVRVRFGKGRREREIPLNATVRRALRLYRETLETARPADPLFLLSQGKGMSPRAMQHTIAHLAQRAKITRICVSAHTLRHTFALTYYHQHPGKLVELAHLMGHDSVETTAIYTQPSLDDLAQDLERSPLNVDAWHDDTA